VLGVWLSLASLQRTGVAAWVPFDLLTLQHMPAVVAGR
jgi:hypothetical protein